MQGPDAVPSGGVCSIMGHHGAAGIHGSVVRPRDESATSLSVNGLHATASVYQRAKRTGPRRSRRRLPFIPGAGAKAPQHPANVPHHTVHRASPTARPGLRAARPVPAALAGKVGHSPTHGAKKGCRVMRHPLRHRRGNRRATKGNGRRLAGDSQAA